MRGSRALDGEPDIEIVASCGDLHSLRVAVEQLDPDVVLTDIRMPPTNTDEGIGFAAELRGTHPDVGVVVLSQYAEPLYAAKLLEESSDRRAYLLEDRVQNRDELSRTVHEVADSRSVVDSRIVEGLLAVQRRREKSSLDTLTPREQQVLGLVAEGWSNGGVAERLVITKRAVERHIHTIFWKRDLGDSADSAVA